jgi:hypothetical protein
VRTKAPLYLGIMIAVATCAFSASPAWSQSRPTTGKAPPTKAGSTPAAPSDPVRTSDQVKRNSVEGAVTAPLRDLNMVRTDIPEVLRNALANPYAKPPARWRCPELAALVTPLDEALGPDIDRLPPGDENLMDRGKSTALGAAADLASGAIPFRGVVRRISGAESHDKLVQSAIIAGNVRRAYLKGLGEARGCPAPATPSTERRLASQAAPAAPAPKAPTPKYPVRAEPAAPRTTGGTSQTAPRR